MKGSDIAEFVIPLLLYKCPAGQNLSADSVLEATISLGCIFHFIEYVPSPPPPPVPPIIIFVFIMACACWKHVLFDRLPKLVLDQAVYIVLILYAAHIDPRQKQAAYTIITLLMECSLLNTIIFDSYNNKESNHVVLKNYCSHSYP